MKTFLFLTAFASCLFLVGCANGTPDAVPAAKTGTAIYIVNMSQHTVRNLQVDIKTDGSSPASPVVLSVEQLQSGERKLLELRPFLREFRADDPNAHTKIQNLFVEMHHSGGLSIRTVDIHEAANGDVWATTE